MKKPIPYLTNKCDIHIKTLCNRLSIKQKVVITTILIALFILASIYTLVFTAYQVGKQDGRLIEIQHIKSTPIIKDSCHYGK